MKPTFLYEAFPSYGGSLRFDLWKHGIVDILSFPTKYPTMEITFSFILSNFLSLSPLPLICGIENWKLRNCGET